MGGVYLEILGPVGVQLAEKGAYTQLVDVDAWQILGLARLFFPSGPRFVNQPHVLKLVQDAFGQPDGDFMLFAEGFCRVRSAARGEPLADGTQDDGAEKVVEAAADVGCFLSEIEGGDVLADVAHFGAKQADAPGNLCPQQEQRDGGKTSVDGIVIRYPYLAVDVKVLEGLECTSGQYAGQPGVCQFDFRVGHESVESDEHSPDKGVGDEADKEFQYRGQYHEVLHFLHVGSHEDSETAGGYQQDRKQ